MIMKGPFKKVILSFMVPGHTKFEPDSLFARIAHKFYKTDIFNTVELLDLMPTCDVKVCRVKSQDLKRWKLSSGQKFRDIPRITECNYLEVDTLGGFDGF